MVRQVAIRTNIDIHTNWHENLMCKDVYFFVEDRERKGRKTDIEIKPNQPVLKKTIVRNKPGQSK